MGCGCKKKKDLAQRPKPRTARVVVVEGEVREQKIRTPEPVTPPPRTESNIEDVVNKLNDILKP